MGRYVRILSVALSLAYAFAATLQFVAAADMQFAMAKDAVAKMEGCPSCGSDSSKKQATYDPACSATAATGCGSPLLRREREAD